MLKLLLFALLAALCWPLALAVLLLYPLLWLLFLPFRLVGIALTAALALVSAVLLAPARLLRAL